MSACTCEAYNSIFKVGSGGRGLTCSQEGDRCVGDPLVFRIGRGGEVAGKLSIDHATPFEKNSPHLNGVEGATKAMRRRMVAASA